MDLVESHVHVWTVRNPRFPKHPDSNFSTEQEASPEDLFAAQDEVGGVAWTVLIQPRLYLWDNSYLAQAAEAHPDRFVVAGRVNPMDGEAPRQLRELMQRAGYRGIRLAATEDPATRWLDDGSQDPLWDAAAETRATIGLLIQWRQLPQAAAMAGRHPDVTVVIDHLGFPDYDDLDSLQNLLDLARLPNVYVKLSGYPHNTGNAYPYLRARPFIERMLDAFGPSRVMWGSDWPVCLAHATYGQAFKSAWELPWLTDSDREWIFSRTARAAWRIPDAQS
ncbi:MAG: amidohydrolase family protein [Chloroflexota bacterium]|nr:amidohydrolase family protein [Chloroflexota bacterium]